MPSGVLSRLNTRFTCGSRSAIRQGHLLWSARISIIGQERLLYRHTPISASILYPGFSFSGNRQHSSNQSLKKKKMADSTSNSVLGDVYVHSAVTTSNSGIDQAKHAAVFFFNDRSHSSFRNASVSFRRQNPSGGLFIHQYSALDLMQKNQNYNLIHGKRSKHLNRMSFVCYSAGAVHDMSYDGNSCDEQLASSTISSDQAILEAKTLKLSSGSCYLPHPDKEETGGEDAHFICTDERVIGVADGVGGWADVGVNAGLFARELMSHAVRAIQDEPKGHIDPLRVLEKAHSSTMAAGSSTACIVALTDKGLHAVNLGDSGFLVVRDGCTISQSHPQQHGFNFTYQLESGNGGDLPHSGEVFTVAVAPGDVIIAGTDGLFDNLYDNEVTAIVVSGVRAGLEPAATAQKIATLARHRALDKNRQTPFSTAAQEAGYRYYGGKLDDITVVVSYVAS